MLPSPGQRRRCTVHDISMMTTRSWLADDAWWSPLAPWVAALSWSLSPQQRRRNLEDRLAYMGENPDVSDGRDISFRLLRRLSSSVKHQKYHGVDIVSVNVANTRTRGGGRGNRGEARNATRRDNLHACSPQVTTTCSRALLALYPLPTLCFYVPLAPQKGDCLATYG